MRVGGVTFGGVLDRWIARMFVAGYAVAATALLVLFMVFDISTRIDQFQRAEGEDTLEHIWTILLRYLLEMPDLHHQAAPFVALGAGLYTTVQIVRSREWGAVVTAGIPGARLFLPVILCGAIIAFGAAFLRQRASRGLAEWRVEVLRALDPEEALASSSDVWIRTRTGEPVFVGRSLIGDPSAIEPVIEGVELPVRLDEGWGILRADSARFVPDEAGGSWILEEGSLAWVGPNDTLFREPIAHHENLDFEPVDVLLAIRAREAPHSLSGADTEALLERDPDNPVLRTMAESQVAAPFVDLLFLLMAIPLAVHVDRLALLRGVLQAVLLCITCFVVTYFLRSLGMQGDVSPILAAWLPICLCASLGVTLYVGQRT